MSEFARVRREQVDHGQGCVGIAWSAGDDGATRDVFRCGEPRELARRHGGDTVRSLDPAVRGFVDVAEGGA